MPNKKNAGVPQQLAQLLNNNQKKQQGKKQGQTTKQNNQGNNRAAVAPYKDIENPMISVDEFRTNAVNATTKAAPKATSTTQIPVNQSVIATSTPTVEAPTQAAQVAAYVAPKPSTKPSSSADQDTLGSMIFWMFLVLLIIGLVVLLFFIMRGKFKSIEKDIRGLEHQPVDLDPLQRDIQRVSMDVMKLKEIHDADIADIDYVKKIHKEKGDAVKDDLQSAPLSVLKELMVQSEGDEELTTIIASLVQSKSFEIKKRGDGIVLQPDTDNDAEWILNADGLIKKTGETTSTLSFSDEWVRVCNGTNCSEVPLKQTEVEAVTEQASVNVSPEHDVPMKPRDTLELLGSISIPKLKAAPTNEE